MSNDLNVKKPNVLQFKLTDSSKLALELGSSNCRSSMRKNNNDNKNSGNNFETRYECKIRIQFESTECLALVKVTDEEKKEMNDNDHFNYSVVLPQACLSPLNTNVNSGNKELQISVCARESKYCHFNDSSMESEWSDWSDWISFKTDNSIHTNDKNSFIATTDTSKKNFDDFKSLETDVNDERLLLQTMENDVNEYEMKLNHLKESLKKYKESNSNKKNEMSELFKQYDSLFNIDHLAVIAQYKYNDVNVCLCYLCF